MSTRPALWAGQIAIAAALLGAVPSSAGAASATVDVLKPGGIWASMTRTSRPATRRANVTPPSLVGGGKVGGVLRCRPGTWTGTGTYTFSWTRDGSVVSNPGANPKLYTPVASDAGSQIRCRVVRGGVGPVTSNAITIVAALPVNLVAPSLTPAGPVAAGAELTCHPGEWTESGAYGYSWTRDGTVLSATGKTYATVVADGGHQIACRVTRTGRGGVSAPVSSPAISVTGGGGGDTTPPETTIDSGPSGTITVNSASFTFSSNEAGSTFECALDSAAFATCTSPRSYSALTQGPHTFQVRAIDPTGNIDASPASRSFTVDVPAPDTTAPTSTHSLNPASPNGTNGWYTSAPAVTLSCTDNAGGSGVNRIEYRLGTSGAYTTYTAPFSVTAQGTTTVQYRCFDNAGVQETPDHSFQVKVDTGTPTSSHSLNPASPNGANSWYVTAPTVTLSCTDNAGGSGVQRVEYRLATSGAYTTYAAPFTITAQGTTTVQYHCLDNAGRQESDHSFQVKLDTVVPQTTITSGPASGSTITVNSATFEFSSNDATATFQCKVDSEATYSACTSPRTLSSLANGTHSFVVRAVDPAGNVDATPDSRSFTVNVSGGGPTTAQVYGTMALDWVPSTLNLKVGDSILWRFDISSPDPSSAPTCNIHNVAMATDDDFGSLDPSTPDPKWIVYNMTPCVDGTGTPPSSGDAVFYTLNAVGGYTWVCGIHPAMTGHVTVTAG